MRGPGSRVMAETPACAPPAVGGLLVAVLRSQAAGVARGRDKDEEAVDLGGQLPLQSLGLELCDPHQHLPPPPRRHDAPACGGLKSLEGGQRGWRWGDGGVSWMELSCMGWG
jgi:hypothetical protein